MQKVARSVQARRELGRKFATSNVTPIRDKPRKGWIRAIREALGMAQTDLAHRLGITRVAVDKFERAEIDGRITMAKLRQVAEAMDCSLVYALIPNSSLDETVMRQARAAAKINVDYTSQTMALEAQDVDEEWRAEALERQANQLIATGRIWK
jgi:predicted DNA-binding mobile mystery protein A